MLPIHCAKKPYEKLADGTVKKVEVPYEIPDSWEWVRLNEIASYIQRGKSPRYSSIPKYPVIAQKCNQWSGFSIELAKFISPDTVKSYQEERLLRQGDLMWNSTGLGTLGRIVIYDEDKNPYGWAVADSHITVIRLLMDFIDYHFIFKFLSSPIVQSVIEEQASGSTKQKELSTATVKNYLIPLPPLAEQKRIVAQIERALEQVEVYAESYHKLQELDKAFPDKLKKSILQYAMQGKLVAQDPNDEPVEVLLEKIRAEKQKLYEEGKLKKKDLAEIVVEKGDDNSPYGKIPRNWALLSVKDIFSITTGLSYKKTDLAINQRGVRIIRGGNIEPLAYKLLDNDYYIEPKHITSESVYLKRNQLVTPVSSSLEHIGKFARIDKNYSDIVAGGFVFQLTPFISSDTLSNYLLLCLSSPLFYKQLQSVTKLSGQALYNIPKTKLNDLRIALAPEQEQERISNKVGQLFQKVNQL